VRFERNSISFYFEKRSSLLQRWGCAYVVVKSEVVGLAPVLPYTHTYVSLISTCQKGLSILLLNVINTYSSTFEALFCRNTDS
jgi:hypothetical protein